MQVESDIAPFKDLLMGLFFMTVGMEISVGIFVGQFRQVMAALALLVIGKVAHSYHSFLLSSECQSRLMHTSSQQFNSKTFLQRLALDCLSASIKGS